MAKSESVVRRTGSVSVRHADEAGKRRRQGWSPADLRPFVSLALRALCSHNLPERQDVPVFSKKLREAANCSFGWVS
jgi:hypothetical protein